MKEDRGVRVAALHIRNILGIQEAEIRPGRVTLVEGRNGEGKTSILEAFRAVLTGGHDVTLLRKGADKGEMVLLLDDGTEIRKTVTIDGSKTKVINPEFGTIGKPASFLDKLRDVFALNPVDFLTAKKDARLQLLLSAIPMKVNPRDLGGVIEHCTFKPDFGAHAMIVLSAIEKDLYDSRTGVNRVVKEKRTTAAELQKALPPEAVQDAGDAAELKFVRQTHRNFLAECGVTTQAINDTTARGKLEARKVADARIEEIRAQLQRDIDAIQAEVMDAHEANSRKWREEEQQLVKTIADLEAKAETFTRTESTRKHLGQLSHSADEFALKSEQLTEALGQLDQIREALLDDMPIKGLAVVDGDITVDGIPFDRLNESRKVRLAIDVAMLRAGALPVLCVDGIESLDSASIAALEEVAIENNIQLVLARVTDGPLETKVVA